MTLPLKNSVALLLYFFISQITSFAAIGSLSEIDVRIETIKKSLTTLPSRVVYPVGGTWGYKWNNDSDTDVADVWLEVRFHKPELIDSIAIVPLATFSPTQVRAYCLPAEIRVTLLGNNQVVFEGSTLDLTYDNAYPLFLKIKPLENAASGIRIDVIDSKTNDPYLGFSEVFAFHGGKNIALGANVVGSSHDNDLMSKSFYQPQFLVDGQSSLGLPVISNTSTFFKQDESWFETTPYKTTKTSLLDFMFEEKHKIHEIRLFPNYAPTNEMLLSSYGHGFPADFRLELLDKHKNVIDTIFKGSFSNPGRNMVSFAAYDIEAWGVRLAIDRFYYRPEADRHTLGLAEVQIFSSENENLTHSSNITLHGLSQNRKDKSRSWTGWLNSGATLRGKVVDLESWLEGLARKGQLTRELQILRQEREGVLYNRSQWLYALIISMIILCTFIVLALVKSRMRQRKHLAGMRRDIANDLHDEIGSNLASIGLISYDLTSSQAAKTIGEIVEDSKEALNTMVWALSPRPIPLVTKLREAADRLLQGVSYSFTIESVEAWDKLSLKERQDVLFWFKESLNNIHKHARAKSVKIELCGNSKSQHLSIAVRDDGCGMDLDHFQKNVEHLSRLQARSVKLEGNLEVRSESDKGCEVILTFKPKLK